MTWGSSQRHMPRITSYQLALGHFETVKPVKRREDGTKPIGRRRDYRRQMRMLEDGSVVFRLYQTDCVTWHPDNSFTLIGHPTIMTGGFIDQLVPYGVSFWATRGVVTVRDDLSNHSWCWELDPDSGRRRPRSDIMVYALKNKPVRFVSDGIKGWAPAPGQDLEPMRWLTLDKGKAKALRKAYRMDDFALWVRSVAKLDPKYLEQLPVDISAKTHDLTIREDFANAYGTLPRTSVWRRDPATSVWVKLSHRPTATALESARRKLYFDRGAYIEHSATEMTFPEWLRRIYNVRH